MHWGMTPVNSIVRVESRLSVWYNAAVYGCWSITVYASSKVVCM